YFLLVETFGDVPLVLEPTTSPTFGWQRTPEKDVYTQIIKDLTDAMNVLPATTADFGRVTKGMAQHLLAKVYLTRGYKSYGGGNSDFTQAANLATDLITNGGYSLVTSYSKLFDPTVSGFQKNTEIIFSVQYSTTTASNGAGNYLQQLYLWDTQSITPIGRSAFYNKPNYVCSPTPFFFSNFDKTNDSRYSATVWDAIMAQTSGSLTRSLDNQKLSFVAGDTVIYYPATAWTDAQKLTKKYFVINPDEYRKNFFTLSRSYPEFKKFRDPSVTSFTDGGGTRDTYIFRLGETYLIAAEAYLKLGDPKALIYFNAVRTRAAKSGKELAMQASSITIDDILDERARELSGEEFRWFELKRTGKLIERVIAHNEEASAANSSGIDAHYLLRPIPQSQIDLNRGDFPQNSKY
ncbi:MAG: RagB/SusD family nutrient uptake outer membrane protein, partial [Bacteroidota bacterium]|nr:RagB/SusD family nutrient uptake outer membrane protein [Bacteroidota bacterium]